MDDLGICIEACVTALAVSEDGKAVTITMSKGGEFFTLALNGVDRFVANEFRQQNVVDRVVLWNSNSDPVSFQEPLGVLVAGSDDPATWVPYVELMKNETKSILSGDKVMLGIEAVYGVYAVALATTYSLVVA